MYAPRVPRQTRIAMSLGLSKVSMYTIEATTHKDKPRERLEGRSLDVGVPAYLQQKKKYHVD